VTTIGIVAGLGGSALTIERDYVDAVVAAGGTPVLVPATISAQDQIVAVADHLDAVMLAGGGDIDSGLYRQAPTTTLDAVDPARDHLEMTLVRVALDRRMRILGICRGAQVIAVATGGTLVQDLPAAGYDVHKNVRCDGAHAGLTHGVKAEPGSLAELVLDGLGEVNSHHHQAVNRTGPLLTATAWSPDGCVEAIEGPKLLGLQWHPEIGATTDDAQLRAFRWLVDGPRGIDS
jgi:putative glutamine amidotransferase